MIVRSFRVKNFKCFVDSGEILLGRGFNVIVGQNNSGKTALLEALQFQTFNRPHKSERIDALNPGDPNCRLELDLSISGAEFRAFALGSGHPISLAYPLQEPIHSNVRALNLLHTTLSRDELRIRCEFNSAQGWISRTISVNHSIGSDQQYVVATFNPRPDRQDFDMHGQSIGGTENIFAL